MKLVKISDLFNIMPGTNLALNKCEEDENGINFVSRTAKNNGTSSKIKRLPDKEPISAGTITVAMSGSVLESFVQQKEYYTGEHMRYLIPKEEMTLNEKLYYCECIKANKFRFNYGRQANKTFADLLIPDRSEIPDWVYKIEEPDLSEYKEAYNDEPTPDLNTKNWKEFKLTDLFEIAKGQGYSSKEAKDNPGKNNFISATSINNGVAYRTSLENKYEGNKITISSTGGCMDCFYQEKPFSCSGNILILNPKFDNFNAYIGIFICTVLELEKFRYNYGRVSNLDRVSKTIIKLPVDSNNKPDYQFMENYMKTLPYSKNI